MNKKKALLLTQSKCQPLSLTEYPHRLRFISRLNVLIRAHKEIGFNSRLSTCVSNWRGFASSHVNHAHDVLTLFGCWQCTNFCRNLGAYHWDVRDTTCWLCTVCLLTKVVQGEWWRTVLLYHCSVDPPKYVFLLCTHKNVEYGQNKLHKCKSDSSSYSAVRQSFEYKHSITYSLYDYQLFLSDNYIRFITRVYFVDITVSIDFKLQTLSYPFPCFLQSRY